MNSVQCLDNPSYITHLFRLGSGMASCALTKFRNEKFNFFYLKRKSFVETCLNFSKQLIPDTLDTSVDTKL